VFDMIDTHTPSPSSFAARVAAIEQEIITAEGYLTVAGRYYAREGDASTMRRVEAERRARNETRYEGRLRAILSDLEGYAVHRGRSLERRGLTDADLPSLDGMCSVNAVVRLVESMARRLAQLERAAEQYVERYEITPLGKAALAEPQEMAS
jgi:hypothetical protein